MAVELDEEFLKWWAEGLERQGIDIDKTTIRIATQQTKPFLFREYSYRECFEAMQQGEYWSLVAYGFAYKVYLAHKKCGKLPGLEQKIDDKEIVPFWEKSKE